MTRRCCVRCQSGTFDEKHGLTMNCFSAPRGRSLLLVAFWLSIGGMAYASDATGFIFTADRATNPLNENETVRLLERLPAAQLKRRFSRYKVDVTAGEDCIICATVSRGEVSIMIDYDETGIVIVGISSNDKKATDALGYGVGSSLRSAIGTPASCEAGMWMTCASPRLIGLHYIVEDFEKCPIIVKEQQATEIPLCGGLENFKYTKHVERSIKPTLMRSPSISVRGCGA